VECGRPHCAQYGRCVSELEVRWDPLKEYRSACQPGPSTAFQNVWRGAADHAPVVYLLSTMPTATPLVIYVSSTEWANKNPATVNAFRGAIADAVKFALQHPDLADQYAQSISMCRLPS
jgi:hypothetical protein